MVGGMPFTASKVSHRLGGGGTGAQRLAAAEAAGKAASGKGGGKSDFAPAWYEQLIKGGGKVCEGA